MTRAAIAGGVYDEKKKLFELQAIILSKGNEERERILSETRADLEKWTGEQAKRLETEVAAIQADAARRAGEIKTHCLIEAESSRDRERLRLQNELVQTALDQLLKELMAFEKRPDYDMILAGLASEIFEKFPKGRKVSLRLRAEDAPLGETVVTILRRRFPEVETVFDPEPAPIEGGVYLYSEEEKWRVVSDWKTKARDMADGMAKAVLAAL
jgi:V/A-type H+-transporting ATPase subunit E